MSITHTVTQGLAHMQSALEQGRIVVVFPDKTVMVGCAGTLSKMLADRAMLEELPTDGVPVQ